MKQEQPHILVVDDELHNLEIINEYLADEDCIVTTRHDSEQAWQELENTPTAYDVILLDWMMPKMDGLELLSRIKQHPQMKDIPVIMQTARIDKQDILRGMAGGAYYYLTKPYNNAALCDIVNAALQDIQRFNQLKQSLREGKPSQNIETTAAFELQTLNEADQLARVLADNCPEPDKVIQGISELLINAIEHGNLNIQYAEKARLKKSGKWREEVEHRLRKKEYLNKKARVQFHKNNNSISIMVSDQGQGFDWKQYLEFSPERAFDCNGRGIAMANMLSFDELLYNETGNEVTAIIKT